MHMATISPTYLSFSVAKIGSYEHWFYAQQVPGCENCIAKLIGDADLMKACVCDGTADESYIVHAAESKVAYILSTTPEEALVLFSKYRRSNSIIRHPSHPMRTIDGKGPYHEATAPLSRGNTVSHVSFFT
jgi:hypothetical protein